MNSFFIDLQTMQLLWSSVMHTAFNTLYGCRVQIFPFAVFVSFSFVNLFLAHRKLKIIIFCISVNNLISKSTIFYSQLIIHFEDRILNSTMTNNIYEEYLIIHFYSFTATLHGRSRVAFAHKPPKQRRYAVLSATYDYRCA